MPPCPGGESKTGCEKQKLQILEVLDVHLGVVFIPFDAKAYVSQGIQEEELRTSINVLAYPEIVSAYSKARELSYCLTRTKVRSDLHLGNSREA